MPITSNETPRGRSLTREITGMQWSATRVWEVYGAANENECFVATALDGSPIAQLGNSHPQSSLLRVVTVTPAQQEGLFWLVTAQYAIPSDLKGGDSGAAQELLSRKPTLSIRSGKISIAVDRDAKGRPRVNSAGDAFDPPGQRSISVRYFRYVRYEPFPDVDKMDRFENTVNDADLLIGGKVAVSKQRLYCDTIEATEDFGPDTLAVPIAYNFILRRSFDDTPHPFNDYIMDIGDRGFYSDSGSATAKLGYFFDATGTQQFNVKLDGTGKPLDPNIKVTSALKTPISNPNPPAGLQLNPNLSTNLVKFLEFDMVKQVNFAEMNL